MFYTRKETLDILEVTPTALYDFIRKGLLTKYKQPKGKGGAAFFKKEQVDSLVAARNEIKAVE